MGLSGGAGRARTDDPRIMSPLLWPTELPPPETQVYWVGVAIGIWISFLPTGRNPNAGHGPVLKCCGLTRALELPLFNPLIPTHS